MNKGIIEKAIQKYFPELKGMEINRIGEGSYAKAYKVGDKVFKITTDDEDAMASQRVKGKELQHIVNIYAVFKIQYHGTYLIVSEYVPTDVQSVSAESKYGELRNIWGDTVHFTVGKIFSRSWDREGMAGIKNANLSNITLNPELLEELYNFAQELWDNGFTNADIHQHNIRIGADGKFKLIDLGHGTSRNIDVNTIQFEELV